MCLLGRNGGDVDAMDQNFDIELCWHRLLYRVGNRYDVTFQADSPTVESARPRIVSAPLVVFGIDRAWSAASWQRSQHDS